MIGRTCIVTGANSGIGRETARSLARQGATVVLACRNPEKGGAAVDDIRRSTGNDAVELLTVDLASLASIRAAAAAFLARHDRLHVLVNNAGLMVSGDRRTEDGFEMTFGVNHLGHFLFTSLLTDALRAGAPSRVVIVSSMAHTASRGIDFDAVERGEGPTGFSAYGASKLANLLHVRELARRLGGDGVTANGLHPGVIGSDFGAQEDTGWLFGLAIKIASPFMLTPTQGAATSIYLASSPEVEGVSGRYFSGCKEKTPSRQARDDEAAARLWALSERLVGLSP